MNTWWVLLGGGLGATCRFAVEKATTALLGKIGQHRHCADEPEKRLWMGWGIIWVNITGCFLVGYVASTPWLAGVSPLLQAGFLGGYTTYSTAIMDTIGYTFKPEFNWGYALRATVIIAASMAVGIAAALAGAWLGCLS